MALTDTASITRNAGQGIPTLEKVADQGADIIGTLEKYSGLAKGVFDVFGSRGSKGGESQTLPTSAPKPAGSPAPASASPLGSPALIVGLVVAAALIAFLVARK